jgi:hypothetical protein
MTVSRFEFSFEPADGPFHLDIVLEDSAPCKVCPADLNNDGMVSGEDLALLLAEWGQGGQTDLNADGTTSGGDLAVLLALWCFCAP